MHKIDQEKRKNQQKKQHGSKLKDLRFKFAFTGPGDQSSDIHCLEHLTISASVFSFHHQPSGNSQEFYFIVILTPNSPFPKD